MRLTGAMLLFIGIFFCAPVFALDRPGTEFPVYQFPADGIPRIDGEADDWAQVPERYVIGTDELRDTTGKHEGTRPDSLDVRVKVGWVKGMNRLYFLYEATDDYWDFSRPGHRNDTFEVVVDGDLSGGPLSDKFRMNPEVVSRHEAFFTMHGIHAQNYHIFTPARDKPWAMLWGTQQWLKEYPEADTNRDGRLTMDEAQTYRRKLEQKQRTAEAPIAFQHEYTFATMSDGVKIALAVGYPRGFSRDSDRKWPVILSLCGYPSATVPIDPGRFGHRCVTVSMSIRGSGASGGKLSPWRPRSRQDGYETIEDWIVKQP